MSSNRAGDTTSELIVSIPQEIVDTAATGAREQLGLALERVPAIYKSLMEEVAERFLDSQLDRMELWKQKGLNEKNHSKLLTQALGDSLWSFIRKLRAETAAHLLADSRTSRVHLYLVALATGFKSACALNAAFKTWSGGIAPSDFRRSKLDEPHPLEAPVPVEEIRQGNPRTTLHRTLRTAYRLAMQGEPSESAFDPALAKLWEAESLIARYRLADLASDVAAHRGLVYHCRGADRRMALDLDGAYADLVAARRHYAAAPRLPRKIRGACERILYPDDTRVHLLKQLCVTCRAGLLGDEGQTLREHLSRALVPVPRDLEWFQICCDECYRTLWRAIEEARLGLMDDAWKASWLVTHADPLEEVPLSLARYVRALRESDLLTHEEQLLRLKLCRTAVETARALGDPLREAYALCFVASTLRAMGSFAESWATLREASEQCHANPWSAAFLALTEGHLAVEAKNFQLASDKLSTARTLYSHLDMHLVGYALINQGNLFFTEGEYEAAARSFLAASTALDRRRAPVLVSGAIPLNCAAAFGALGRRNEARAALGRCEFDRRAHRRMAATELMVSGCLALAEHRYEDALGLLGQAATTFDTLDRLREKALAISYSVAAYAGLGKRARAVKSAAEALRLFQALGCNRDTVEVFARLSQQLDATVDAIAVADTVCRLAKAHGGWLPSPSSRSGPPEPGVPGSAQ